ncbi:phage tail assembly protein [Rouxiella badensis]|uniref:phage tail assembly protein n=1 Tax=Rouxiella badensis TaxID=1646377 RepID=UPI0028A8342E|nr:phage tail assembly protein [Rouxiella badensis]
MQKTITLGFPVVRGKTEIKEVTITEAMQQTGSLRGLKLYDVMTSDVDSLIKLLPRVTSPSLTEVEVSQLNVQDFSQLAAGIADFLAPSSVSSETAAGEI